MWASPGWPVGPANREQQEPGTEGLNVILGHACVFREEFPSLSSPGSPRSTLQTLTVKPCWRKRSIISEWRILLMMPTLPSSTIYSQGVVPRSNICDDL